MVLCTASEQAATRCWIRSRKQRRWWPAPSSHQQSIRASGSSSPTTGLSWHRLHPSRWPCLPVPITCKLSNQKVSRRHLTDCCCSASVTVRDLCCAQHLDLTMRRCVFTKASTRWCRGQIGGGWEETDSGNSSSHNSSQEMVANSRTSEGSKSAGTESQSEASKESSGDLSERCVDVLAV